MVTHAELAHVADHDRTEVTLQTALTYDGMKPVVLSVSKRDRRYRVTDGGGALAAADAQAGGVAFPETIAVGEYEVNVSSHGIVFLSAVSPTPEWLETVCEIVGRGSIALYEGLLDSN